MTTLHFILEQIREHSHSEREKGGRAESLTVVRLCKVKKGRIARFTAFWGTFVSGSLGV